jgi:hypothetical protein
MPVGDLSPLAYFKELHLIPRIIFTIGGALFFTGLFRDWRIAAGGVGLIFVGVGYNFFAKLLWHSPHPPYEAHISWANLFQGIVGFVIAAAVLYVVFYSYRHGVLPPALRPIQDVHTSTLRVPAAGLC